MTLAPSELKTPLEAPLDVERFARKRVCVVPRPQAEQALRMPATRQLTVVEAGMYAEARGHHRERERGGHDLIVMLCTAGSGAVELGSRRYAMGAASAVILPPHVPHAYRASPDAPWTIWWAHVRGAEVAALAPTLMPDGQPVTSVRSVDRAVALFDELVTLLERRITPASILAASGIAWQLLTRLAADSALPVGGSELERAMRYLEERVDGHIAVADLAALVGMSPSHLTALFRKATGSGPAAFHTSLKMARARTLLDTTTFAVNEVAQAIGYADALYFSRTFRKHHGVSPSLYRAQSKG